MKKLFIYALLLMTGFAFYSCDDRFDNPVAEQQDPTNPNATWSYEVSVKFSNFSSWYPDVDGKMYTYTAPSTIYVYNKSFEKLGELTVTEPEEFPDSFTVADFNKSYKFAGKLQGAIGEELIISSLDDFDYITKQDGTLKSLMENCVLETAKVPIIITNATKKTIGTKSVELKSMIFGSIWQFFDSDYFYPETDNKGFTFSGDSLYTRKKGFFGEDINIKFAENIDPSDGFFFAFATAAQQKAEYRITIDSENGYKSYNFATGKFAPNNVIDGIRGYGFSRVLELDLSKYSKFLKDVRNYVEPYYRSIYPLSSHPELVPIIYQSSKDTVNFKLTIQGKATIKNLVIGKKGYIKLSGYYVKDNTTIPAEVQDFLPTITVEGENSITTTESAALIINSKATLLGDGTLKVQGADQGVDIEGSYYAAENYENDDEDKAENLAASLTISENVKLISNANIWIGTGYDWNQGKYVPCSLIVNGTLEAKGQKDTPAISYSPGGIFTIGSSATSVKATSGQTDANAICIFDGETGHEAAKFDETKYTDVIKDGTRTITPKK